MSLDFDPPFPPLPDDIHHITIVGEQRRVRLGVVVIPRLLRPRLQLAYLRFVATPVGPEHGRAVRHHHDNNCSRQGHGSLHIAPLRLTATSFESLAERGRAAPAVLLSGGIEERRDGIAREVIGIGQCDGLIEAL